MRFAEVFTVIALVCVPVAVQGAADLKLQEGAPDQKLISTFQIVRFPNSACTGSNSKNGTCYTSAECSDKSGSSSGSCADGFGVCCIFSKTVCASSSSENATYWSTVSGAVSTTVPSVCALDIMPLNDNICQLRLDFKTFIISGPSTTAISQGYGQMGVIPTRNTAANVNQVPANAQINWSTNCLTDQFTVSGVSSANSPNLICGTNSGVHMYVDANRDRGNRLQFAFSPQLGPTATAADKLDTRGISVLGSRTWDLVVYQYECGHINSAPPGCTQYHWGPLTGRVTSYNYQGTFHLANQNQKICLRREKTTCYACFYATTITDIGTGGETSATNHFTYMGQPCGYNCEPVNGIGAAGSACFSADCVIVPNAFVIYALADGTNFATGDTTAANIQKNSLVSANGQQPAPPQVASGGTFGIGIGTGSTKITATVAAGVTTNASVCTKHIPFQLTFKSDGFEGVGGAAEYLTAAQNIGVNLNYELITCT